VKTAGIVVLAAAAFAQQPEYGPPRTLATISIPGLDESSGIAASKKYPAIFWTHNDGDGGPFLFAFDSAGKRRGKVRISGAAVYDWEDIAIGPGNQIYIGDIGDNDHRRKEIIVYRVAEPDPGVARSSPAVALRLRYPDGPHDAEALLVHPKTGEIYIVTKARGADGKTGVYKAPASPEAPALLKRIAAIDLPGDSLFTALLGKVTGGDISPDGRRVVLCDYLRAWEAIVPDGSFDGVWKQKWRPVDVGKRAQGEGICYRHDGKALLVTSEGGSFPLIEVQRK
jgi:hypothetical protein